MDDDQVVGDEYRWLAHRVKALTSITTGWYAEPSDIVANAWLSALKDRKVGDVRRAFAELARTADGHVSLARFVEFLDRPDDFYRSSAWRKLRYQFLSEHERKCSVCGSSERLHVDHIIPRSKCPERELDVSNLQILCEDCNIGKSDAV